MKNNILLIVIAFLSIFTGCIKDESLFVPDPGPTFNSNILGIVNDESNNPVEGAVVYFNGLTETTDKNGVYQFKNVPVSSKHSFLKIRKPGYFEASRAFNTQKESNIKLVNTLLTKSFNKSFDSSVGGSVAANNYNLQFPANSIVIEASGASYNGIVKVAVKYLDPSLPSTYERMPGNLMGLSENNELQALTTYGMLNVELQSTNGEKLQIKSGNQVAMSVDVPASLLPNSPATIPLWYFDESIGYWKEEGFATLNPQTGAYTGNVNHFSTWNYDDPCPSVNVSGKVIDQNGNPLVCQISFTSGSFGGYGQTNFDGTYSGPVAKDKPLTMKVIYYGGNCGGSIILTQQVGPFSTDAIIPDIIVTLTNGDLFEFSADVIDCSGSTVQNGYARINDIYGNHYFPILNGHVEGSILSCFSPIIEKISFVDSDNYVESDPLTLNGPGPHNLGTQTACGNQAEGWSMKNDSIGFNEVHDISFAFDSFPNTIFYSKPTTLPIQIEFASLEYDDQDGGNFNSYNTGQFTLKKGSFYYIPTNTNYQVIGGTITVTQGGIKGDLYKANYAAFVKKPGTIQTYTVTGNIIWTIQ